MFRDGNAVDDGVAVDTGDGSHVFGEEYLLDSPILDADVQSFFPSMNMSPTLGELEPPTSGTDTTSTTPSWELVSSPSIPTEEEQSMHQTSVSQREQQAHMPLPSAIFTTGGVSLPQRHKRKPIPRKGHTKSRKGCLNCKRRKVKCQETRPECAHCQKMGLSCEWPSEMPASISGDRSAAMAARRAGPGSDAPISLGRGMGSAGYAIQSGATFNIQDMQFFQHFLTIAYPPLPIDGSEIWKGVGAMAHQYDFLIHAMLGLGASHLTLCGGQSFSHPALMHRIAAMKSLNTFLSRSHFSKADGDAAFAAAMSLTFQSTYMEDGLVDFLATVRGCKCSHLSPLPQRLTPSRSHYCRQNHSQL